MTIQWLDPVISKIIHFLKADLTETSEVTVTVTVTSLMKVMIIDFQLPVLFASGFPSFQQDEGDTNN